MTLILGIETSCDETAAAVIADGRTIFSSVVASQVELHRQYGGVFPEMASRQHVLSIIPVVRQAMANARVSWDDLAAIAVTHGPGLAGSLLVGVNAAKGLAYGRGLALIGINHIEAHIATNWLQVGAVEEAVQRSGAQIQLPKGSQEADRFEASFPLLCLIVSGGHTDLILMEDYGAYKGLGGTIDDAAGEAFDKVARLLDLGYPGGPAIQRAAERGSPHAFSFPRARTDRSYDFSFSGLKTAVLRTVQRYEPDVQRSADKVPQADGSRRERTLHPQVVADMAASFQAAVVDVLVEKTCQAADEHGVVRVLLAGGVAANQALREKLKAALRVPLRMPPVALATDNATGVGVAGYWALRRGQVHGWDLDVVPRLQLA